MLTRIVYIVTQESPGLLNNAAFAAFLGSFSAFALGIVAYDYTKKRERWKQHHDAVVKAERLISRQIDQIFVNITLLSGAIETFNKEGFSENLLIQLENSEISIDLHNLEFINKYEDYHYLVEIANRNMTSWNRSNDRMFTSALSGKVKDEDIAVNRRNLSKRSSEVSSQLKVLVNKSYTMGAYIREFIKDDKRPKFGNLELTSNISISSKRIARARKKFVKRSKKIKKKLY